MDGHGARFTLEDSGVQSPFAFTNGDEISIEAWVQVDEIRRGENVYVIGKGRTGSKGFSRDNQNWALRVRETGERGSAFCLRQILPVVRQSRAVIGTAGRQREDLERANFGIIWQFRIGLANRIACAARSTVSLNRDSGTWAARQLKLRLWMMIPSGSLHQWAVRHPVVCVVHWMQLPSTDDALMKSRFRRIGGPQEVVISPAPEVMPELGQLNSGQVSLTFHEGMTAHTRWLNDNEELPAETLRWQTEAFLLDRLPQRFDAWGIRADWKRPVLMRFAADVPLTPGNHQFLMHVRGLSRLWVNGELIARGKPLTGKEPITPVTEPLRAGMRLAEHRQQEVLGEATIGSDRRCRVVLETMVGGKNFRTDPGEVCVAVESADGKAFELLQSSADETVLLTDSDVAAALNRQEMALQTFDDDRRRMVASSQDEFWESRHAAARNWASEHPAPSIPSAADHPIDTFVGSKIKRALAASAQGSLAEARQFHSDVLPILRDNCFRCHGNKDKGGLLLDSHESAIKGDDSTTPAVLPGNAAESELQRRVRSDDVDEVMPPGGGLPAASIGKLEAWIQSGAEWPAPPVTAEDVAAPALLNDTAFVRRVFLDTVGVIPDEGDVHSFLENTSPDKRLRLIDQLLADERFADHWVAYWQDVLAENPTLINASLNTTGPFRWFLFDALRDNKSLDRLVTELILLRGSTHEGGSAGFGIAANNDAPMAAKGQIVAGAFLGIELQCARCHDSPYRGTLQSDLYSLAAMFQRKPVTVPATSRVPVDFFEHQNRDSLIQVTLKPDKVIDPRLAVC